MAVSRQLQSLPLCPVLNATEPLAESGSPVVRAQAQGDGLGAHQIIEEPRANEVEELGEELDGESRVDPTAAQQRHGTHKGVEDALCWWEGGVVNEISEGTLDLKPHMLGTLSTVLLMLDQFAPY